MVVELFCFFFFGGGGGWHYLLDITGLLLMTCVGVEQTHFNPHNMYLHVYGEHKLQVLPPCHMLSCFCAVCLPENIKCSGTSCVSSCQTVQINKWKIAIELSNPVVNNLVHQSTSQSHNQISFFIHLC